MAILEPLMSIANSLQPVVMIANKLINKIFFIFYFSIRLTRPTFFHLSVPLTIHNINMSIATTIITDGFIRHYKSSGYPLWSPYLGSKCFSFSFLFLLWLHNMHSLLSVSFYILVFFFVLDLVGNEK